MVRLTPSYCHNPRVRACIKANHSLMLIRWLCCIVVMPLFLALPVHCTHAVMWVQAMQLQAALRGCRQEGAVWPLTGACALPWCAPSAYIQAGHAVYLAVPTQPVHKADVAA